MFSPRVPNSVASSKKVKTVVERLHSIFGLFEKSQQLHIMVFWSIPPQEKNALSFCSPQPCTKTFIEKTAHILADPLAFFILEPFYEQIKQPQGSTYKGGRSRIIIWLGNEASDVTHVVSSRRLGNPGLEPNAVPKSHRQQQHGSQHCCHWLSSFQSTCGTLEILMSILSPITPT